LNSTAKLQYNFEKTVNQKNIFIFGCIYREATPHSEGWRVFCREVEFFLGRRKGRKNDYACLKIFGGGVNEAERNEHDHTDSAGGEKTE
jgi:hypothetical protein